MLNHSIVAKSAWQYEPALNAGTWTVGASTITLAHLSEHRYFVWGNPALTGTTTVQVTDWNATQIFCALVKNDSGAPADYATGIITIATKTLVWTGGLAETWVCAANPTVAVEQLYELQEQSGTRFASAQATDVHLATDTWDLSGTWSYTGAGGPKNVEIIFEPSQTWP